MFGQTYAAEPDVLIEQLEQVDAVMAAATLMLTIPAPLRAQLRIVGPTRRVGAGCRGVSPAASEAVRGPQRAALEHGAATLRAWV